MSGQLEGDNLQVQETLLVICTYLCHLCTAQQVDTKYLDATICFYTNECVNLIQLISL